MLDTSLQLPDGFVTRVSPAGWVIEATPAMGRPLWRPTHLTLLVDDIKNGMSELRKRVA